VTTRYIDGRIVVEVHYRPAGGDDWIVFCDCDMPEEPEDFECLGHTVESMERWGLLELLRKAGIDVGRSFEMKVDTVAEYVTASQVPTPTPNELAREQEPAAEAVV
jgi:hypothetical protein